VLLATGDGSIITRAARGATISGIAVSRAGNAIVMAVSSICHGAALFCNPQGGSMNAINEFLQALRIQRWDDHRYYHHSRVNQTLHLISALSFLCAYVLLFIDPAMAALVAWLVSMTSRQAGHFFFEPRGYDHVNQASHEHKEEIKVGYNLRRKIVLLSVWVACPLALLVDPTLGGMIEAYRGLDGFAHDTGLMWLALGVAGLLFRTVHLFFLKDVQSGLVWMTKILTDPFHDVWLYHSAPLHLLRGEWIDPMHHARRHG
jgi:hypothetical protein